MCEGRGQTVNQDPDAEKTGERGDKAAGGISSMETTAMGWYPAEHRTERGKLGLSSMEQLDVAAEPESREESPSAVGGDTYRVAGTGKVDEHVDHRATTAPLCPTTMGACYAKCASNGGTEYGWSDMDAEGLEDGERRRRLLDPRGQHAGDRRMEKSHAYDMELSVETESNAPDVTQDLEEWGANYETKLSLEDEPPRIIEVDYEDTVSAMNNRTQDRQLDASSSKGGECAPAACGTLHGKADSTMTLTTPVHNRRRGRSQPKVVGRHTDQEVDSTASRSPWRRKASLGKEVTPEDSDSDGDQTDATASAEASPSYEEVTNQEHCQAASSPPARCSSVRKLCLCEVSLHNTLESCWLVANKNVYDVTGVVSAHPAGPKSILRKAGGPDCTKDMNFHSKGARRLLDKCFIGRLQPCGEESSSGSFSSRDGQPSCSIM